MTGKIRSLGILYKYTTRFKSLITHPSTELRMASGSIKHTPTDKNADLLFYYLGSNIDYVPSVGTNMLGMTLYENNGYITLFTFWIGVQFRVGNGTVSARTYYGDAGWSPWHNLF